MLFQREFDDPFCLIEIFKTLFTLVLLTYK